MKQPKIAIIADWLTNMGGAERVVLSLHKAFPDAPIYTSVFSPEHMPLFRDLDIRTTSLQKLPAKLRARHQLLPTFRAKAFAELDLSEFDVIISSASAEAKAVKKRPGALHICYCHTPTRYYWSHYEEYRRAPGFGVLNPLARVALPALVGMMRKIDLEAVEGVDYFIANSHEVQNRIKKYYHRDSIIIFPPIDVGRLRPKKPVKKEDFYLIVGRQIPYKRVDLAISACNELMKNLVVIGNGSEHEKLVKMAGPTIDFQTNINDQAIVDYFQKAKAFIFPSEEDFGITPVEAMSAGTPVIAYKKGGSRDYLIPNKTGLTFDEQTTESVVATLEEFEQKAFDSKIIMKQASQFSEERFIKDIQLFVKRAVDSKE